MAYIVLLLIFGGHYSIGINFDSYKELSQQTNKPKTLLEKKSDSLILVFNKQRLSANILIDSAKKYYFNNNQIKKKFYLKKCDSLLIKWRATENQIKVLSRLD